MREAALEQKLVAAVNKYGGLAWKFVSPGHAGVPDRIVMMPKGRIIFVELKTETGKLTPLQIEMHNQLRELGMDVRVLYGKQYVEGFIREIQTMAVPKGGVSMGAVAPQVRTALGYGLRQDSNYTDGCETTP